MIAFIKSYFPLFLSLFLNLWIIVSNEKVFLANLLYSSTFILLDNTIVDVAQNGIHFFDKQFQNEETTHFIQFSENLNLYSGDITKISVSQFSQKYEEYILILCKRILYIFDNKHNLKININLYDSLPDTDIKIIAYKKENDYLHYLITYISNFIYKIIHFKYNLNNNEIEKSKENEVDNSISVYAFQCLFMSPQSFSSINYDILNCFYMSKDTPNQIYKSSYDPEQNFKEIESLRCNIEFNYFNSEPPFFGAITNEEKDNALIFFCHNENGGWVTFNNINNFTNIVKKNDIGNYMFNGYAHKLLYFNNTKEFIIISTLGNGCKKFFAVFNNDLTINYSGILDFGQCSETGLSNIFYENNNYTVIIEKQVWNFTGSIIIPINEINFTSLEILNPSTIPSSQKTNIINDEESEISIKITNKIITSEPKISTTELTIITTEPVITTTEPVITTTEPIITTTEPVITTTEPIITTTEPVITTTEPIITTTEPVITTTEPIIITTEPKIITTEPVITTTEPIITTTEPIIITTEPKIITTEPDIITTEPKIITTESKISTTEPTIITNEPTIITNKPTISTSKPIITTTEPIVNTLVSTVITEETEIKNYTQNIKCKTSNYQSYIYDLCLECNIDQEYFPAEFPDNSFLNGFTECYNSTTKPINFYFDNQTKKYKACYETCLTCNKGGNFDEHNCLSCDVNLRKEPDKDSTNCITECAYYYYVSPYGQYKCTNNSICPDMANLYIKDLKKCSNDCSKEKNGYIFQYGGQCLKNCPNGTSANSKGFCMMENSNSCSKSEREIDLQEFLTNGEVDTNAKNYANEFNYTKKHVSYFYNTIYSIILYKDSTCINELSLDTPKVDFGNCYIKLQQNLDPPSNDSIIISLIEKKNDQKNSSISYFFYHPVTGEKLDAETICKDEEITIKESVLSQLINSKVDINSALFLTQQDINIFNLSDEFYTDLCYSFVSKNGKDVPLNARIKAFYPNITLCDSGCMLKGIDLKSMESICECKFNNIKTEYIDDNALLSNTIGEVFDLFSSSNLLILKCYKQVFKKENIIKSYGGFIVIGIVFFQLIFSLIFGFHDMSMIRKFLHNITEYFMAAETIKNTQGNIGQSSSRGKSKKRAHAPPKRRNTKEIPNKKNKKIRSSIRRHSYKSNGNVNRRKKNSKRSIFLMEDYSKGLNSNSHKTKSKLISSKLSSLRNSKNLLKKQKSLTLYRKQSDLNSKKLLRAKTLCGNLDIEEYLKTDLDDYDYDDAIKFDKRTFFEFFIERLSEKQITMNTFYYKENLRPKSIKIILLLLNIDLYFVINGFFYNEEFLTALFNSNVEETFFSYISRSFSNFVYATLVGVIIGIIIDCIFIEESKVKRVFLREKENPVQLRYEISIITTEIKKRYRIFILLCFFIAIISWYYVSCFNNVYPGIKIEWIKSSITIIIIMQILSILIVLLEAIVRDLSYHYQSEKLYKFKQFLS